ncbi:tumor protein D52 isoform X4 [Octopus sinensis]|uniref:Tumor protein D52 isoform X4 n=1 Tax=Octopus sinensis TaxID=2607531 RepID=A0A6P7S5L9_9MOLL|nr:tumor protein D52 isoform X4 [Octopus sinensis]
MAATKPSRLFLSGDHPGKYQPFYFSNGDTANEDMYQPNAASSATYMKFLHLVDTQLSDDEPSSSPPPPATMQQQPPQPPSSLSLDNKQTDGDNYYDPLSPPAYDTVTSRDPETPVYQDPVDKERQEKEWQEELSKIDGEILTLRQVLTAKVRRATELKRKLGITPLQEFKQDIQSGFQQLRDSGTGGGASSILAGASSSDLYQKTSAAMKTASEKTTSAISVLGASVSKKFDEMRNSQTFKTVEERVENAYTNVKGATEVKSSEEISASSRVKGSKSNQSLNESFQASSEPSTPRSEDNPPLPEEKVPL